MANFSNRIQVFVDVITGQSTPTVAKLRTEISNTEGAFNKMRVGARGAFDLVKQHAATAALAAGTALAAFATKAVGDFQDVALGAGQLRDSLGVTAEEASRLQEVAGDLGIGVASVETAIGRMNRTASTTPQAFDDIGASIKRNRDGTIDVVGTFTSAADAIAKIPDSADRAAAAQKVFGRGWQDISRLIMTGADGITRALADVEDAKIMDDEEIARAEAFRDTMDELKGVGESFALSVGSTLVPALTDAAEALLAVKSAADVVGGININGWSIMDSAKWASPLNVGREAVERLSDAIGDPKITASFESAEERAARLGDELGETTGVVDEAAAALLAGGAAAEGAATSLDRTSTAAERQRAATDRATEALEAHREELLRGVGQAFAYEEANLRLTTGVRAFDESMKSGEKSAEELRLEELALAGQALQTAEAFAEEEKASGNAASAEDLQKFALQRLQDQFPGLRDEIQVYIDKLNAIPSTINTTVNLRQGSTVAAGPVARGIGIGHTGGTFGPEHDSMVVGRAGAEELVTFDNHTGRSGRVDSTETMRRNGQRPAAPITVNVTTQSDRPAEIAKVISDVLWRERVTRPGRSPGPLR